jgi:hypothetical protein
MDCRRIRFPRFGVLVSDVGHNGCSHIHVYVISCGDIHLGEKKENKNKNKTKKSVRNKRLYTVLFHRQKQQMERK